MDIEIYTLAEKDMDRLGGMIPEEVIHRIGTRGYYALGAADNDGVLVGALVYYIGVMTDRSSYARLNFIFVDDELRRKGIGTALLDKLHRLLASCGVREINGYLPVIENSDPDAEEFFKSLGYEFSGEKYREYHGTLGDLVTSDFRKHESSMKVKPLEVLDQKSFDKLLAKILTEKDPTNNRYATGAELELDISGYDPCLSTFYITSDAGGLLLVRKIGPKAVEKAFLKTYGKNAEEGLFELVMISIKHAQITMGSDTEIFIGDISPISRMIIDEFAPDARPLIYKKGVKLLG